MTKYYNSNNDPIYLDQEGYEEHLRQIENLNVNLGRLYEKINQVIKSDSKEEYNQLINLKNELKEKIELMKDKTNKIVIIEKQNSEDIIDINDTIKINICFSETDKEENILTLVGAENDFSTDIPKISINSPLGKVLYKSKINDTGFYYVRDKKIKVEIVEKINQKKLVK